MWFRIVVSLLAVLTVCLMVLFEQVLIAQGIPDARSNAWDTAYDMLPSLSSGAGLMDGLLILVIYTVPETVGVIAFYHLYVFLARVLGLASTSDVASA